MPPPLYRPAQLDKAGRHARTEAGEADPQRTAPNQHQTHRPKHDAATPTFWSDYFINPNLPIDYPEAATGRRGTRPAQTPVDNLANPGQMGFELQHFHNYL